MYKNIISFFSFPFITQNIRMCWIRESRRQLSNTHRCWSTSLQWSPFLPSYLISRMPMQIQGLRLQPVTNTITLPSSMPPTQFTRHFRREYQRPVYFRYLVHFLLFSFLVSDFCSCIERCQRGLQVNIQHLFSLRFLWFSLCSSPGRQSSLFGQSPSPSLSYFLNYH